MKSLIIVFLTICCIGLFTNNAQAQFYKSAVGLRLGYPASVSYKQFVNEKMAFEVYAGTRGWTGYRWFNVSGALQVHTPIEDLEGLSYYYGGGASVYFWTYDNFFLESEASTSVGIQGYLGLDYAFDSVPINITIDWIPTFFVNGFGNGFGGGYGSLDVRYIFNEG